MDGLSLQGTGSGFAGVYYGFKWKLPLHGLDEIFSGDEMNQKF